MKSKETAPLKPYLPDGQRIYSVGDIHGRLDLLQQIHQLIEKDASDYQGKKSIIYLGDYIDRGEQSKGVIEQLLSSPLEGFKAIFLLGNHEQTLLDFLQYPKAVASWLTFGGKATLHSYGVTGSPPNSQQSLERLRDNFELMLPQEHLNFYRALEYVHIAGNYCFVHAGIRPGISIQEQRNEDLLWIRDDFITSWND